MIRSLRNVRSTAILILASLVILLPLGLVSCGDDNNNTMNPPPGGGADVTIQINGNSGSSSFSPNPATVTVGQTVAWHNAHSVTHTATADGGEFDTGNIGPGQTSTPDTMKTAGSFPYRCSIHTTMVGTLVVNP